MTATIRRNGVREWAIWTASFLSFPLAGILGGAVAGPVDAPAPALLGGAVTGLVVGAGQALAGRLDARRWIPATTVGMAAGLLAGAAAVGYRTSLSDLALMGLITGVPLGIAQALALTSSRTTLSSRNGPAGHGKVAVGGRRWLWAVTTPLLWSLGWTVTTLVGVDVERQYTIFGSTGAITVSALAGVVLQLLRRAR
jgi:hypothetical protein